MSSSEIVRLNVGGTKYITAKSTFTEISKIYARSDVYGKYPFINRRRWILLYWSVRSYFRIYFAIFKVWKISFTEVFYRIEELILAVEHHRGVLEVKERDEVHVLLFCIFRYNSLVNQSILVSHQCKNVRLFKKSKDTGFQFVAYYLQELTEHMKQTRKDSRFICRMIVGYWKNTKSLKITKLVVFSLCAG